MAEDQDTPTTDDQNSSTDGTDDGSTVLADTAPTEVETLAGEMGWTPKDKWTRDPDSWVDAPTFIKSGPDILRNSLRSQDAEIAAQGTTITEMRDSMRRMEKAAGAASDVAYARALTDLKAQRRDAATEGDMVAFDDAEAGITKLEDTKPVAPPAGNGEAAPDAHFLAFAERNKWYGEDVKKTIYADQTATIISGKFAGAAFYTKIEEEMEKEFPAQRGNANRGRPARVIGGDGGAGGNRGGGGKKAYADLPDDAKGACDSLVEQGISTKESYCKTYFADEG